VPPERTPAEVVPSGLSGFGSGLVLRSTVEQAGGIALPLVRDARPFPPPYVMPGLDPGIS